MAIPAFSVTWDYRCPFARNAHEHLIEALEDGANWDVTFVPFNLGQVHVPEGGTPMWEDPEKEADLLAPAVAVVVRDNYPDRFLELHRALFTARHEESRDLREREVVRDILEVAGVPAEEVFAVVDSGAPVKQLRAEHEAAEADYGVWGVPTFITGGRAVFARLMNRPKGDAAVARSIIEKVVRLIADEPELNEFKETRIRH
jgi:2-hydroxychromene-2-carboxylate isomerase